MPVNTTIEPAYLNLEFMYLKTIDVYTHLTAQALRHCHGSKSVAAWASCQFIKLKLCTSHAFVQEALIFITQHEHIRYH